MLWFCMIIGIFILFREYCFSQHVKRRYSQFNVAFYQRDLRLTALQNQIEVLERDLSSIMS